MSGLANRLLDLVYPPKCPFCQRVQAAADEPVCRACWTSLIQGQSGKKAGAWFSGCVWAVPYAGQVREAILRFKFQGCRYYSRAFGEVLAACIRERELSWDVMTWAPVSRKRKRERGYDQAELLCRETADCLSAEPVGTLEKTRNNPAQSTLQDAAARAENVKDVYRVPEPSLVAGKRILLIDDITTTGSTLSACSHALLLAGADGVWCAALAGSADLSI